jgi:putative glutathione S-transferase
MYIGLFCPFAHRANLVRHLKGLTDLIDVSVVKPYPKGDEKGWPGWQFPASADEYPAATADRLYGSKFLHEVYFKADPGYKGRYSVPVLWDRETETIVNNESAELLRDLQTGFNPLLPEEFAKVTLYPEHLRQRIDEVSAWMQRDLNTGVYKAGFAESQEAYDKSVLPVFAALNKLEKMIAENGGPYILGKDLTELDIRAYATLIRFDTVYEYHFKCNLGSIRHDYPQLNNYIKNLYWNVPGFRETTNFKHIKENYTKSHYEINPKAITPRGPYPDIEEGYEPDLSKIKVGVVAMPEVVELEKQLV